jgi:hypothetical protein
LIAPANNTFPAELQFASGTQTAVTTIDLGSGPVAATLTMYPDGSMAVGPNSTAYVAATSATIATCTLSYTATATPAALTYGTLTNFLFSGTNLATAYSTTVYYSTSGTNVVLCIPALVFSTNGVAANSLASVGNLPNTGPKLTPAVAISVGTNGASYKSGVVASGTIAIGTNGAITYTVAGGNFPTNSQSTFGFYIGAYAV